MGIQDSRHEARPEQVVSGRGGCLYVENVSLQ